MTEQMDWLMESAADGERAALIRRNKLLDQYRPAYTADMYAFRIPEGTEIIVERASPDPKTGAPRPEKTKYYRTILGSHSAVSGKVPHLVWEASDEWPEEPPWQSFAYGKWIYPDNGPLFRYWIRKSADENGVTFKL